MKDSIAIGTVAKSNEKNGTVDVIFPDRDNVTAFDLPMMDFEYNMPSVGEQVLVAFLTSDFSSGYILGRPFNNTNVPRNGNAAILRKELCSNGWIEVDKKKNSMTINIKELVINGDLKIAGNLSVSGNLNVTGEIVN